MHNKEERDDYIFKDIITININNHCKDRIVYLTNTFLRIYKIKKLNKLEFEVKLCNIWISCSPQTNITDRSILIGWPLANHFNVIFQFETFELRNLWLEKLLSLSYNLKYQISECLKIKILANLDNNKATVCKAMNINALDTVNEVISRLLIDLRIELEDMALYQLNYLHNLEEIALYGFENPYSIQKNLSKSRDSANNPLFMLKKLNFDVQTKSNQKLSKTTFIRKLMKKQKNVENFHFFNRDLADFCSDDFCRKQIISLINYLSKHGPETIGIFRRCANATTCTLIIQKLNNGSFVNFDSFCSITAAHTLKYFLRNLPDCILGCHNYNDWLVVGDNYKEYLQHRQNHHLFHTALALTKKLLYELPIYNRWILCGTITILYHIHSAASVNSMTSDNLSKCIGPSLLFVRSNKYGLDLSTKMGDRNGCNNVSKQIKDLDGNFDVTEGDNKKDDKDQSKTIKFENNQEKKITKIYIGGIKEIKKDEIPVTKNGFSSLTLDKPKKEINSSPMISEKIKSQSLNESGLGNYTNNIGWDLEQINMVAKLLIDEANQLFMINLKTWVTGPASMAQVDNRTDPNTDLISLSSSDNIGELSKDQSSKFTSIESLEVESSIQGEIKKSHSLDSLEHLPIPPPRPKRRASQAAFANRLSACDTEDITIKSDIIRQTSFMSNCIKSENSRMSSEGSTSVKWDGLEDLKNGSKIFENVLRSKHIIYTNLEELRVLKEPVSNIPESLSTQELTMNILNKNLPTASDNIISSCDLILTTIRNENFLENKMADNLMNLATSSIANNVCSESNPLSKSNNNNQCYTSLKCIDTEQNISKYNLKMNYIYDNKMPINIKYDITKNNNSNGFTLNSHSNFDDKIFAVNLSKDIISLNSCHNLSSVSNVQENVSNMFDSHSLDIPSLNNNNYDSISLSKPDTTTLFTQVESENLKTPTPSNKIYRPRSNSSSRSTKRSSIKRLTDLKRGMTSTGADIFPTLLQVSRRSQTNIALDDNIANYYSDNSFESSFNNDKDKIVNIADSEIRKIEDCSETSTNIFFDRESIYMDDIERNNINIKNESQDDLSRNTNFKIIENKDRLVLEDNFVMTLNTDSSCDNSIRSSLIDSKSNSISLIKTSAHTPIIYKFKSDKINTNTNIYKCASMTPNNTSTQIDICSESKIKPPSYNDFLKTKVTSFRYPNKNSLTFKLSDNKSVLPNKINIKKLNKQDTFQAKSISQYPVQNQLQAFQVKVCNLGSNQSTKSVDHTVNEPLISSNVPIWSKPPLGKFGLRTVTSAEAIGINGKNNEHDILSCSKANSSCNQFLNSRFSNSKLVSSEQILSNKLLGSINKNDIKSKVYNELINKNSTQIIRDEQSSDKLQYEPKYTLSGINDVEKNGNQIIRTFRINANNTSDKGGTMPPKVPRVSQFFQQTSSSDDNTPICSKEASVRRKVLRKKIKRPNNFAKNRFSDPQIDKELLNQVIRIAENHLVRSKSDVNADKSYKDYHVNVTDRFTTTCSPVCDLDKNYANQASVDDHKENLANNLLPDLLQNIFTTKKQTDGNGLICNRPGKLPAPNQKPVNIEINSKPSEMFKRGLLIERNSACNESNHKSIGVKADKNIAVLKNSNFVTSMIVDKKNIEGMNFIGKKISSSLDIKFANVDCIENITADSLNKIDITKDLTKNLVDFQSNSKQEIILECSASNLVFNLNQNKNFVENCVDTENILFQEGSIQTHNSDVKSQESTTGVTFEGILRPSVAELRLKYNSGGIKNN